MVVLSCGYIALAHLLTGWRGWAGNIELLREELNLVVAPEGTGNWKIPLVWSLLIKYVCPTAIVCVLGITFQNDFGHYGNYADKYHIAGMFCGFGTWVFVGLGLVFPELFDPFGPKEGSVLAVMNSNAEVAAIEEGAKPAVEATDAKMDPLNVLAPTEEETGMA